MILTRLQERLGALAALIPLSSFTVASLAFTFDAAGMTGHARFPLESRWPKADNGLAESVRLRSRGFKPRQWFQPLPGRIDLMRAAGFGPASASTARRF